ncbi:MAG: KEOPS complex subunit Cgi121 [Thermoplasmata archaeon]
MRDSVIEDTEDLRAWSANVRPGEAESFLNEVVKPAMAKGVELLIIRADMVFGIDHLRSAVYHARRSMQEGTNASGSLTMETLLYASGEKQLSSAIKKMSFDRETEEIVVAALSEGSFEPPSNWRRLSDPLHGSVERLVRFGITEEELSTLKGRNLAELVLEKVAAVDILKK